MFSLDYMKEHNIKSVDTNIDWDMRSITVCVKFFNGPKINIVSAFNDPNFMDIVKRKIEEHISTRERRMKLKKIKNKMRYGYFRRIFKRT